MRPNIHTILHLTNGYRFPEFFSVFNFKSKVFSSLVFSGRVGSFIDTANHCFEYKDHVYVIVYMNKKVLHMSRTIHVVHCRCIYLTQNKLPSGHANIVLLFVL